MSQFHRFAWTLVVLGIATPAARAQFNVQWATFVKDTNRIQNPNGSVATQITTDVEEKDYAVGDVNMDGWKDVVVVRKAPQSTLPNKRVGYLMMNENGILVDRTSQYAVDSDVAGDFGLNTPVCNRDVKLVDVNGDGWLDMITSTSLSDGDLKHISHPRIYRNKGSISGVWQGFKYEDARIPQFYTIAATPLAVAPRFCEVAVGDVTGDGFPDLYFADYDTTEAPGAINEAANADLNDRLLINDGNGYFTDSLETRMTTAELFSTFAMAAEIYDMNGDGYKDILKDTALTGVFRVSIAYNDPTNPGNFPAGKFDTTVGGGQPYHIDVGDLNNDGKPDLIVGDDGVDYYRYNTGNDGLGRVIWGPNKTYQFLSGSDDGFPGDNMIIDLDGDGWKDVITADVDVDLQGCNRRLHIYHNPGGTVGSQIILREEIQNSGSTGWKGVVGPLVADLQGTFDFAAFDIDNDGDIDLVLGRCAGTQVWINQKFTPTPITSYCFGDGTGTSCPCSPSPVPNGTAGYGCPNASNASGARLFQTGFASVSSDTLVLNSTNAIPFGPGLYFQGSTQVAGGTPFGNGLLCVGGSTPRLEVRFADGTGASTTTVAVSVLGSNVAGNVRNYQLWYRDGAGFCTGAGFNLSNAVNLTWAP